MLHKLSYLLIDWCTTQESDEYTPRESPAAAAAARKTWVQDGDSSGPSDNEEMSDVLKKDPIISKYSKYRITKKTSQQKSSCTCSFV